MTLPAKNITPNVISKAKAKTKQVYQKNDNTIKKVGAGIIIAGITFFAGRAIIRHIRRRNTENNAIYNPDIQQAMLLRSAMNPSGVSWLMSSDGTNETALFNIAKQITDFNNVAQQYRNLYNKSLIVDLQKELNDTEFANLMNILNTQKGYNNNTATITYNDKYQMVYTKTNTKFYANTRYVNMPFAGKTLPAKTIPLALTTGREITLSLFGSSLTQQIIVIELQTRTPDKKIHKLYIPKNEVVLFDKDKLSVMKNYFKIYKFSESDF